MDNITTSFEILDKVYNFVKERELKEIRFEFIISALFPEIYKNIQEEMRKQHALGFIEGQNSIKK